jgi:vacuolar-type H+-ATPase subunit F/Vma7
MRVQYIGDALTGAGLALVGVRTSVARPVNDGLWQQFRDAHASCELLILASDVAADLGERLETLIEAEPFPVVAVLPDVFSEGVSSAPSVIDAMRVLGVGAPDLGERQ